MSFDACCSLAHLCAKYKLPSSLIMIYAPDTAKTAAQRLQCFHCKDECPDDQLVLEDKHFCCTGCKMAFQILNTHQMCDYYTLDAKPGQSMKGVKGAQAFAYLDDAEIQDKLLDYRDAEKAQVTLYLPQMHCVSCLWLLEHLYKLDQGVTHSRVNFLKKTATIQFDPSKTSLRSLAALLASIGYAPEINLGDVDAKPKAMSRRLAYQLGVAGFAFGNIMLFSFPEYVGMDPKEDAWFANIFGYLSIFLAIPVLVYSARDYLTSAWNAIITRHINLDIPLALGIVMLFGRSAFEIITHTGAGYMDSFAALIFLLLTGKWFQQKTWHQLSFERDYKSYFPVAATIRTGDSETTVPVERLVPGDIIVIRSGEIIPADGLLLKGTARVDYSFVTGEADPQDIKSGERIYAGGRQIGQSIEISLTRRVSQSSLTRLWNNDVFKQPEKSHVSILAERAGSYFTWLILGVGSAGFLFWAWMGNMTTAVNAFTAVMIIACPCAVALAIPFTLGNILRILGRHRFYLKNTTVLETFSTINSVVFDKTGTITNVANQEYNFKGNPLNWEEKIAIRSLTKHSGHPLSRQLYESMNGIVPVAPQSYEEITGEGIVGMINGHEVRIGSGKFTGGPAEPGVHIAFDGQHRGYFEVKSRYRTGLAEVLAWFKTEGDIWLLSGDHNQEANALSSFFEENESMRFKQSPQDKLEFIQQMQRHGRKVMMLGDGLNDAGALQQSNLGVVIAENTNNFTPACDAILHAEEFEKLPAYMKLARSGVRIVNRAYYIAFIYNVIGLSFAVTGTLSPLIAAILMPLSSVTIVLFGVLSGNLMAYRHKIA